MDFVKLGSSGPTQYLPYGEVIEGYTSLIWTERFESFGDFELKTFDVEGMKALLPEKTFVSHLETQEMMMVETHSVAWVGEGADAVPELTITGRSASVILEDRFVEADYRKKRRMRKKYTASSAIAVLVTNAVNNGAGVDLTRGDDDPDTEGVKNSYPWTTKDVLPNVSVTRSVTSETKVRWWQLTQGTLYPQLANIMIDADIGIRCNRPVLPNSVNVITVKSALASRGQVDQTLTNNVGDLCFDIYTGIDRSAKVQFSQLQGHLDSPEYLESCKDHKTSVEVMSGEVEVKDVYIEGEQVLTGWDRRVMGMDAGTPEIPPEPRKPEELRNNATSAQRKQRREAMDVWLDKHAKWKNKRNRIVEDFREEQIDAAKRELKKARRVDMFSGDVSNLTPYKFKVHYNLGDIVTLVGNNSKVAKMMVSEYVRTEDSNGDKGIPGLVVPV